MQPPPMARAAVLLFLVALLAEAPAPAGGVEVLAKSRLERCARDSGAGDRLKCDRKIVLGMAVPSGSSGGEASLVVLENNTEVMESIRDPPVITVSKSAAYIVYDLIYVKDVAYKPEEQFVKTRKCEPDADASVVKSCERLRDKDGKIIEHTEPICCSCGDQRHIPLSCGSTFVKMIRGKPNTAHCLRFLDDWFHVFEIGQMSIGFTIRVQVKRGSFLSEVTVGLDNRTVISKDNFLRVNVVGDFVGYKSGASFEDFYLVTPRKGVDGDFSRWMLIERVRFTLNGLECNKIGVGYEAYRRQPNFCLSPFGSCLDNQLWNFWEDDKNRINKSEPPQYVVQGRFQRINQHPNAGIHTFSVGIIEVLYTNLMIELSADVEYVYQRSLGKIIGIEVLDFKALSQVGTAIVTTKNTGKLEASYSLTLNCSSGINEMKEQLFTMKPDEVFNCSFDLYLSTDQASKYQCAAILKASDFHELDRFECQFSTTATVLDNGTQIGSSHNNHAKGGIKAFLGGLIDFLARILCSTRCSSFFNFNCHIRYICIGWIILNFVILLAVVLVLRFLRQKGLFNPLYDWWKNVFGLEDQDSVQLKRKKSHMHSHHYYQHWYHVPKRHRSDPTHQHHHILHRHSCGQLDPAAESERHHRHGRHEVELGVWHMDGVYKHRHGKGVAALLPREMRRSGVDHKERRHHRRHSGEYRFDCEHHHSWAE